MDVTVALMDLKGQRSTFPARSQAVSFNFSYTHVLRRPHIVVVTSSKQKASRREQLL